MSLIPSESFSFPDSFRATIGWRPLTEEERRRSPSNRPDSHRASNGAETHTTNGQGQAQSQSPRQDYKVEVGKLSEPTTEQATLDLSNEASQKSSIPVTEAPSETISPQSPPVTLEAQPEMDSPATISAEPPESKEEAEVAPQLSITEIFQKIAEAQGQLSQPQPLEEAKIESPPAAQANQTESPEKFTAPLPGSNIELSEAKGAAPVGVQLSITEILQKIAEAQGQSVEPKTQEEAKSIEFPTAAESKKEESAEETPSPSLDPKLARVSDANKGLPKTDAAESSQSDDKISAQPTEMEEAELPAGAKTPARIRIVPRKLKPRPAVPADQSSVPAEATRLYDDEIVSNGVHENDDRRSGDPEHRETFGSKEAVETLRPEVAPRRIGKPRFAMARPGMPFSTREESRGHWIRFGLAEIAAIACFLALLYFGITHHFSDPTLTILVDILIFAAGVAMIVVPIAFIRNSPARWRRDQR
jgi:hypothetical protein